MLEFRKTINVDEDGEEITGLLDGFENNEDKGEDFTTEVYAVKNEDTENIDIIVYDWDAEPYKVASLTKEGYLKIYGNLSYESGFQVDDKGFIQVVKDYRFDARREIC